MRYKSSKKILSKCIILMILTSSMFFSNQTNNTFAGALIGGNMYLDLNSALNVSSNGSAITLTSNDFSVSNYTFSGINNTNLTIKSSDRNIRIISGANVAVDGGVFYDNQNQLTLNLENIQFDNNKTTNKGGVIATDGAFNLIINGNNIKFTNNSSSGSGGAIYSDSNLYINSNNTSFSNNTAGSHGGAIYVSAKLYLYGSNFNFDANTATQSGGAIYSFMEMELSGNNNTFTNNKAGSDGGAIRANGNLTISGNNNSFTNNFATNSGGAILVNHHFTLSGDKTYFFNNTAGGIANSIHFSNVNNSIFSITTGDTIMYDPISSASSGGNTLTINKTSTGKWILGGNNNMTNQVDWNINSGTLLLTRDSANGLSAINHTSGSFSLNNGATLLIAPHPTLTATQINTQNTSLLGAVGLGSDYRYTPKITLQNNVVLLDLTGSVAITNSTNLVNTSGTFALGQYDYLYDNLHWQNADKELVFNIRSSYVNPDRSGGYSVQAPLATQINNKNNEQIFLRVPVAFDKLKKERLLKQAQYFTNPQTGKSERNLWVDTYYNQTKVNTDDIVAGSNLKSPGIILGSDWSLSNSSFLGGAISSTWSKYRQGQTKIKGTDIRLNLYGGTLLDNDVELGYLLGVGFGRNNQQRFPGIDDYSAKYNSTNYFAGVFLSKTYQKSSVLTFRPFLSYEFIHVKTKQYTEIGQGLAGISVAGHNENLSRIRLGAKLRKFFKNNDYIEAGLYWQGQFGNRKPTSTSWLNTNPGAPVIATGGSVDKNSIGINLSWGKVLTEKADFILSYRGLYGSKSVNHQLDIMYNYRF